MHRFSRSLPTTPQAPDLSFTQRGLSQTIRPTRKAPTRPSRPPPRISRSTPLKSSSIREESLELMVRRALELLILKPAAHPAYLVSSVNLEDLPAPTTVGDLSVGRGVVEQALSLMIERGLYLEDIPKLPEKPKEMSQSKYVEMLEAKRLLPPNVH